MRNWLLGSNLQFEPILVSKFYSDINFTFNTSAFPSCWLFYMLGVLDRGTSLNLTDRNRCSEQESFPHLLNLMLHVFHFFILCFSSFCLQKFVFSCPIWVIGRINFLWKLFRHDIPTSNKKLSWLDLSEMIGNIDKNTFRSSHLCLWWKMTERNNSIIKLLIFFLTGQTKVFSDEFHPSLSFYIGS